MSRVGDIFINLCTAFDMCILNGMCYGDLEGHYTYNCETGSSVVDYFLVSCDLFSLLKDNFHLHILENIESDHLPVKLSVIRQSIVDEQNLNTIPDNKQSVVKICWNSANEQNFKDYLN